MSKPTKTYLIFETEDKYSSICSIKESKKLELIILPKFAENYSEIEFGNPNNDRKIREQHYTVHHSRESNEEENYLKHTITFEDGSEKVTQIFTRAFNNNLFCPLLSVRGQDFSINRYNYVKKNIDKYLCLGEYLPKESTVYYMIIATSCENTFESNYDDLNYKSINFENYSLIILWSFGIIPSHFTGHKAHFLTLPEFQTQLQEGFKEAEIINLYRSNRQLQHWSFLEFIKREKLFDDIGLVLTRNIGFKKKPNKTINKSDKNRIALNLGFHYFLQGKKAYKDRDHKTAINYFLESKKIFKKQNELISLADVLNSEGILFHTTGDPKKALKAHNEALKLYIHLKLDFKVANSYLNLSMVYQDSMQIQKGRENIEKSILISEKNKFHSLLSDSYKELGILYKNDGKNDLAEKNLNKALASYKKFKNQEGIAFCYGNLGIINLLKGKFKESIKFHSDALDIFADLNNNWGIANEKANVGNLNCILGKEIGFKQLDEALNMHKKIGYQYGVATDLKLIGFHQFNGKDTVRSIKNLEKSRQILLKLENLKEADYIKSWIDKIKASN